jgi:hypothetical protein
MQQTKKHTYGQPPLKLEITIDFELFNYYFSITDTIRVFIRGNKGGGGEPP